MPLGYLRRPLFLALLLYMAALAWLHANGFFSARVPDDALAWRDGIRIVDGVVASPRREDGRGVKLVIDEASVEGVAVGTKMLAYLPRDVDVVPGVRVRLTGSLRLPRRPSNPGEFDERGFFDDRGIGWIVHAEKLEVLEKRIPPRWRLAAWAERARMDVQSAFAGGFNEADARLLTGLTLGYKAPLPRELNRAIQDSGAMHLLVPSGAKVGFVLLIVGWLGMRLGLPAWARLGTCAVLGGFYTVMVGADPPYARAYLGGLALGIGLLADRESGAFQALVISGWIILLLEPRALFSAGFQMTYAAMIGLVVAMPSVDAGLPRGPARAVLGTAIVTIIVQMMLWPIFANTFGRAALLGAIANIVLVPLSGVILASGFAYYFLGHGAVVLALFLSIFKIICFHASSLPLAAVDLAPLTTAQVLAYYVFAAAILLFQHRRIAAVLAAASILLFTSSLAAARFNNTPLKIVFLHGPETSAIAFDHDKVFFLGPPELHSTARHALKALGVRRIDGMIDLVHNPRVSLCERDVCFRFDPPRVRRGQDEFGIIGPRLQRSAVEASTDGSRIEIKTAAPGARH